MGRLGIDIGGTKVALRAEDGDGRVAESTFRWHASDTAQRDLDRLHSHVRALLADWPVELTGIGVAVPATCDAAGVVRTWPGRPSWVGLDLTAALRALFPATPVAHADDGDLAAVAEARAARCPDVLYLGVGTGVGGGVVLDDRPWPGPAHGSCEVGHVVVDRAGPTCDCGRRGCVQAAASGPATLRRAARLRGHDVTYPDLVDGTRAGEDWALAALKESAEALAAAVVGIGELAHPALAVLGGGFAAGLSDDLVPLVAREVEALTRPGVDPVPVRPAMLGGLSSLRAALLLADMTEERPS
jgi:kanosamine 6-kinase